MPDKKQSQDQGQKKQQGNFGEQGARHQPPSKKDTKIEKDDDKDDMKPVGNDNDLDRDVDMDEEPITQRNPRQGGPGGNADQGQMGRDSDRKS